MGQNGTEKRVIVYLEYVGGNERNASAHKILKALTWLHRDVELVYGYKISSLRITISQETAKRLCLVDSNIYPVLCSKVA